jgi:hypothetical protein
MKLKWPTMPGPPSLQTIRLSQCFAAAFCAAMTVYDYHNGDNFYAIFTAFCSGFNIAGAWTCTFQIRAHKRIDEMSTLLAQMHELNGQLIAGHVEIMQGFDQNEMPQGAVLH